MTPGEHALLIRHALRKRTFSSSIRIRLSSGTLFWSLPLHYCSLAWSPRIMSRSCRTTRQVSCSFGSVRLLVQSSCSTFIRYFLKVEVYNPATHNTVLIKDRRVIQRRYLKSWFLIDVVGCAPVDLVHFLEGSASPLGVKFLICLRLLRLVKLVRIPRTSSLVHRWLTIWAISLATQSLVKWLLC